jgi:hypothetical protein
LTRRSLQAEEKLLSCVLAQKKTFLIEFLCFHLNKCLLTTGHGNSRRNFDLDSNLSHSHPANRNSLLLRAAFLCKFITFVLSDNRQVLRDNNIDFPLSFKGGDITSVETIGISVKISHLLALRREYHRSTDDSSLYCSAKVTLS